MPLCDSLSLSLSLRRQLARSRGHARITYPKLSKMVQLAPSSLDFFHLFDLGAWSITLTCVLPREASSIARDSILLRVTCLVVLIHTKLRQLPPPLPPHTSLILATALLRPVDRGSAFAAGVRHRIRSRKFDVILTTDWHWGNYWHNDDHGGVLSCKTSPWRSPSSSNVILRALRLQGSYVGGRRTRARWCW